MPPQSVFPLGQAQEPFWQDLPEGQGFPQVPQSVFVLSGLQTLLQHPSPWAQALPQVPQFSGSNLKSMHCPLHKSMGKAQTQAPWAQRLFFGHTFPQDPQFFESSSKFLQVPPQSLWSAGQEHWQLLGSCTMPSVQMSEQTHSQLLGFSRVGNLHCKGHWQPQLLGSNTKFPAQEFAAHCPLQSISSGRQQISPDLGGETSSLHAIPGSQP
ncbi:MAG: hypothetical protein U1F66_05665 [bacterium]